MLLIEDKPNKRIELCSPSAEYDTQTLADADDDSFVESQSKNDKCLNSLQSCDIKVSETAAETCKTSAAASQCDFNADEYNEDVIRHNAKETSTSSDETQISEESVVYKRKQYLNRDINVNREDVVTTERGNGVSMAGENAELTGEENLTEAEKRQKLVRAEEFDKRLSESSKQNRMRLAISLLLRIVLPLASGVASRLKLLRTDKLWKLIRNIGTNKQTITNILAYAANTISLGLSSVQVSHRIDPIIRIIKLKKAQIFERKNAITFGTNVTTSTTTTTTKTQLSWETQRIIFSPTRHLSLPKIDAPEKIETAEQCVSIKILCEPPAGEPIRADIIFIHGLHGSLPNTWKQGLWSNERMPVDFKRPPKPPLRPPKRTRHSRSNIFVPPHSNKKPRWAEHVSEGDLRYVDDKDAFDFVLDQGENDNAIYFNAFSSSDSMPSSPSEEECSESNLNVFSTFRLSLEEYESPSPCPRAAIYRPKNAEPTAEDIFPFEQPYSRCWPGDWLPIDCPGVRVIAIDYTTDPHLWRPVWIKKHHRSSMTERVRVMTERLIKLKVGHNRPIVWVGHSKGGLYIKQILVDAWESGKPAAAPLWQSARGTFFYSVPHRGSTLADISLPLVRRSIELIEIEKNSKVLLDLHRRFVNLYYSKHLKIEVFSFVETAMTFMQVVYLRIVGVDSADPGIGDVCGLQLDHREICKPRSRKCILYTELVKMINKVT